MVKKVRLGILGLGTVATGVVENLINKKGRISTFFPNLDIEVIIIAVKDIDKIRSIDCKKFILTQDPFEVVTHSDVDIVVELIGGETLAYELIVQALKNDKHIVTANKAVISKYGKEIFELANTRNCAILYEASVAGGIPIIKTFQESLHHNKILQVRVILNGTCNFILTQMEKEHKSFNDAVKLAQDLGYAESDPTLDTNGLDSVQKLIILTRIMYGCWVGLDEIILEGIDKVTLQDIKDVGELNYSIKLLGKCLYDKETDSISLVVRPTLIEKKSRMAGVDGVFNAVELDGDIVGKLFLQGEGAGKNATASAVISDIVSLAYSVNHQAIEVFQRANSFEDNRVKVNRWNEEMEPYYIKCIVPDIPNTLSKIVSSLGELGVNIHSIYQIPPEEKKGQENRITIITYATSYSIMKKVFESFKKKVPQINFNFYPIDD